MSFSAARRSSSASLVIVMMLTAVLACSKHADRGSPVDQPPPPPPPSASPPPPDGIDSSPREVAPGGDPDIRATGRDFLEPGATEGEGYGLYSYLLFGSRPNHEDEHQRYLAAIEAFLERIESMADIEKLAIDRAQLNITYLPVTEPVDQNQPTADWLLERYDFARAQVLLSLFSTDDGRPLRDGPYILSYRIPLGSLAKAEAPSILQDMSGYPQSVIGLWIDQFLTDARAGNFGPDRQEAEIALRIRTKVAQIANSLPAVLSGIDEAATLIAQFRARGEQLVAVIYPRNTGG